MFFTGGWGSAGREAKLRLERGLINLVTEHGMVWMCADIDIDGNRKSKGTQGVGLDGWKGKGFWSERRDAEGVREEVDCRGSKGLHYHSCS